MSLTWNKTIYALSEWWPSSEMAKKVTWIIKFSFSASRAATANSLFETHSTFLIVKRALVMLYDLQMSFWSLNLNSTLFKVGKDIFNATCILILANKKVSWKKLDFLSLLSTWEKAMIISSDFTLLLFFFQIVSLVLQMQKARLFVKVIYIAFTLLSKLMSVLTENRAK